MSKNNFQVGDEVVFVNSEMHESCPEYYPKVGTVGTIVEVLSTSHYLDIRIRWPRGALHTMIYRQCCMTGLNPLILTKVKLKRVICP